MSEVTLCRARCAKPGVQVGAAGFELRVEGWGGRKVACSHHERKFWVEGRWGLVMGSGLRV